MWKIFDNDGKVLPALMSRNCARLQMEAGVWNAFIWVQGAFESLRLVQMQSPYVCESGFFGLCSHFSYMHSVVGWPIIPKDV